MKKNYMVQPPGFVDPEFPDKICKLQKAIYGLKQALRAWFEKLSSILLLIGFSSAKKDHSPFIKATPNSCLYVLIYVDDILITRSNETEVITSLITSLSTLLALKDLG
uniref:Reverse transcriptase Ty1/copia-type domain-containing protein n=1 Tax=Cannabis sativa TaxID=3483 RepID=A0A803NT42_CANSA